MCFLTLESDNPRFSHIIHKHPDNVTVKSIRKGVGIGYYDPKKSDRYCVYFEDSFDDPSFFSDKTQEYDYHNLLRYCSPIFVTNAITEFFKIDKHATDDINHRQTMIVSAIKIDKHTKMSIDRLLPFYPSISMIFDEKWGDTYRVVLTGDTTMDCFIQHCFIMFAMVSSMERNDFTPDREYIAKVSKIIVDLKSPYYPRYLIGSKMITNKNAKKELKTLEKSDEHNIKLCGGNTQDQRKSFIAQNIDTKYPIVDIGCGDGNYASMFAQRIKDLPYYAYDTDNHEIEKLRIKMDKKNIINVKSYNNYDKMIKDLETGYTYNVIVSEVIEHNEYADSISLLNRIIKDVPYEKIIITTPNKDFNQFYLIKDGEFRHNDHKYELTKDELIEYGKKLDKPSRYISIGDSVDTIYCTHGLIID